ncbi:hypothetical protein CHLNCDRAFT_134813 [Chlorella variabilis]|uniref:Protein FAM136A n=1 Tax=Chlorella variabilis TaxID=554065 RepID=E1ZGU6_CHLVA|nr:hypothetical protein CHLNCDRAFT_134813 [Chlorella variabilis]EFN54999.1 hypothetical protein CHLNCDRAFT_134813 [Chlorella variabilis]|eukprot:XP_005847101.1 hypothetical protein CHLNCDRAFT_134813 [Chlorella variabilis]
MADENRADGLRKSMEGMVDQLDKQAMRPLQKASFLCQAKCCDTAPSQAALQQCCGDCEQRVVVANQIINTSIREFQDRLQRCVQRCQDKAQEQLSATPSQKEVEKAQKLLSTCAADCAQEYEKQVPKLHKDITARLQQLK